MMMALATTGGDRIDFLGTQFGYHSHTSLGRGNYRVVVDVTGREFDDLEGGPRHRHAALLVSLDQEFGKYLGGFLRLGRQNEALVLGYRSLYSAGVDIRGGAWGRPGDNIGVGFSYLGKGSGTVKRTRVGEVYYRFVVNPYFAVTADIQYMSDDNTSGQGPSGMIYGLRMTATF